MLDDYIGKWIVDRDPKDLDRCVLDLSIMFDDINNRGFDKGLFEKGLKLLKKHYSLSKASVYGKILGVR